MSVILRPNLFQPDNTFVFIDKNTSCPYYFLFSEVVCIFYSKLKSTKKTPTTHFGFEKLVSKPLNTETIEIIPIENWKLCIGSVLEMQAKANYQYMGDQVVHLFKQISDKTGAPMLPLTEVDNFLKYYANSHEYKLDQYSAKNFLDAFKKYFFGKYFSTLNSIP
ncbi:MAG: hypothetical protein IPO32_13140 [Crocinitomicaceae bacterium]|nr:hypothetical protein [Crocinitomicaceae bacterium]